MTQEEFWDYIVAYCRTKRATIDDLDALRNSEAGAELKKLITDDCQIWRFRSTANPNRRRIITELECHAPFGCHPLLARASYGSLVSL